MFSFRSRYLAIRQAPVIPARPFRLEVTILESSFMMLRENFLIPIFTGSVRLSPVTDISPPMTSISGLKMLMTPASCLPSSSAMRCSVARLSTSSFAMASRISWSDRSSFFFRTLSERMEVFPSFIFSMSFLLSALPETSVSMQPILPQCQMMLLL